MDIDKLTFRDDESALIKQAADSMDMDITLFSRWAVIIKAHEVMELQDKTTIETPFGDK